MEFNCGVEVYDKDEKLVASYKKIKDAADAYGVTSSSVSARIKAGKYYKGLLFKRGALTCDGKEVVREQASIPEDFRHQLLDYKEEKRICYTPCPYNREIKIGSVLCQGCSSFKGMDRENHKLACNRRTNM